MCAPPKKHRFLALCRSGAFTFYVNTLPRRFARLHLYKPQDFWSNLLWTVMVWTAFGFFCIMVFLLFLSESQWECCTSFSIAPTSTSESSLLGRPSCTWYLLTFLHLSHWFSFCSQFCYTSLLCALSKPLSVGK